MMKMNENELGLRLKEARKSWGFRQRQVAEYLDMTQGQYSRLEIGIRKIQNDVIDKLCLLYNIDEEWLLYGEGESNLNNQPHICTNIKN